MTNKIESKIPTKEELKSKMLEAINYQFLFGGDNIELKKEMAAENCAELAIQFSKIQLEVQTKINLN